MRLPLAALAAASIASAAHAAPQVSGAWSRPAAQGTTGAGFMTLSNPGAKPDALVSVESPLAGQVMVHQSSMSGGMASMKMVAEGVETTFAAVDMAERLHVEMPIATQMRAVLRDGTPPDDAIRYLMERALRSE